MRSVLLPATTMQRMAADTLACAGVVLAGETLCNETHWPDGLSSSQQVVLATSHSWRRVDNGWRTQLAEAAVRDLASCLPSRDGLQVALSVPNNATLVVLFDVDVRDSAKQHRKE